MISESLKRRLLNSANSLKNKYDMFYTNHQYKNKSFKSEEEYDSIQKTLSMEIQSEENSIRDLLKKYFNENYPTLKFKLYDSRAICITKNQHQLGSILIEGIPEIENEINLIKESFKNDTDLTILITRWESLPDDVKEKLTNFFHF